MKFRQAAASRLKVVLEMGPAPRARDGAGDGGMTQYVLEEELPPARAIELGGPRGQLLAFHLAEEGALRKRAVDDDRHLQLGAQRQQPRSR